MILKCTWPNASLFTGRLGLFLTCSYDKDHVYLLLNLIFPKCKIPANNLKMYDVSASENMSTWTKEKKWMHQNLVIQEKLYNWIFIGLLETLHQRIARNHSGDMTG